MTLNQAFSNLGSAVIFSQTVSESAETYSQKFRTATNSERIRTGGGRLVRLLIWYKMSV